MLLTAPGLSPTWTWARWLPHLGGRVGDTSAIQASLVAGLVAHLDERRGSLRNAHWTGPWTVIVIDGASALAELPGLAQLLQSGPEYGITAICLDEYQQRLPAACTAIASVTGETGTRLRVERAGELPQADVIADQVSGSWADAVARALASLVDASSDVGSTIPTECRLLEINGIERPSESAVLECWRTGGRPLATLGVSGDGAMTIDLAADGPHTLIAGTTGAGKSELLQSLVAGLAISNSPSDLSFILIDYKGGAAFADCARLPHTAGLVTDLDGHLTERALRSLNAELRRREALFAAAGATDLAAYRDSPEHVLAPLGRLVLVVDEFAALADELPDLLTGLVSVAQRGRSLGLHLVLATQRPAGVVSPEIQANLALRISLRVTDPGESATVIGTDAAARIDKGRPGRAYVRTGTTLTEFQTARVAAPGPRGSADEITITRLDEWGRAAFANEPATDRPSDLSLLADTMRAAAASAGLIAPTSPWLPPLPERVGLADLARTGGATVAIGLVDQPDEQRQVPLLVDLRVGGPLLVAGPPRTGRSTVLRTLAIAAAAPTSEIDSALYVIDCAGGALAELGELTQCGAVVTRDQPEAMSRLLNRLAAEVSRRQLLMANRSAGSLPALLVLLDGWENFVVASEAHDAGASVELLHGLVREAASAGLTVALSGGRAALTGRVTASITRTYLLGGAPADLALIGVGVGTGSRTGTSGSARTCGSPLPPGRAVAAADGNHVQFAVTDDNWQRTIAGPVRAPLPIRLRPLPQAVRRSQLSGYQVPADHVLLGLGGDGADPVTVDLFADDARWLIAGPPRSGRSTLLVSILAQSGARSSDAGGCNVLIAASRRSPLVGAGEALGVRVIRPDTDGPFPALYGQRQLVLVDDCEAFTDTAVGAELERLARQAGEGTTAVVVAGRPDDLAVTFRGVAAEVRRAHTGILLRPAPGDGDLLGVHLGRSRSSTPPGRGVLVSHQPQLEALAFGEPALPIQIAG